MLKQFFDPAVDPFYSSYNVGAYTFSPFKVVWKEICSEIEAAVIEQQDEAVIPDHKLVLVGFDEAEPAYFLSGLLNASPIRLLVRAYTVATSISGHIADFAKLPAFSAQNTEHRSLAAAARRCHELAATDSFQECERTADELACKIFGIGQRDLNAIRLELAQWGNSASNDLGGAEDD